MSGISDQLHDYVATIERDQAPVTADEALGRVATVRVSDQERSASLPTTRLRNIAIAAVAAAAFLLVVASPYVFGRWIDTDDNPGATSPTSTVTTTTVPTWETSVETHLGTWEWTQSSYPERVSGASELRGLYYAVETDPWFDADGQPIDADARDPRAWLLVSDDLVSWERRRLPGEMENLLIGVTSIDDQLVMYGRPSPMSRSQVIWTSSDGITWTADDSYQWADARDVPASLVSAEGADAHYYRYDRGSRVGDIVLESGWVYVQLPDELWGDREVMYSSSSDTPFGSMLVLDANTEEPLFEVESVTDDTTQVIRVWRGSRNDGDLAHEATIHWGSSEMAAAATQSDTANPGVFVTWRSDDGGENFELVDGPFTDALANGYPNLAQLFVDPTGEHFLAFGSAPNPDTTRTTEDDRIGAIASSTDGKEWRLTFIPELTGPYGVVQGASGGFAWNGSSGFWMSEDGVTGRYFENDGYEDVWFTDDLIIKMRAGRLLISRDGDEWSRVDLPPSRGDGYGFSQHGSYVTFETGGEPGVDRAAEVWIGRLVP